ncbi:hypothetical protein NS07_v2contig00140-0010 [Nocardia seriolae]|nr:hypothetical protein NS07_v2contig00140-0010 [Nocardia seriolae]
MTDVSITAPKSEPASSNPNAPLSSTFSSAPTAPDPPLQAISESRVPSGKVTCGGVSERPKEHASKACEG